MSRSPIQMKGLPNKPALPLTAQLKRMTIDRIVDSHIVGKAMRRKIVS